MDESSRPMNSESTPSQPSMNLKNRFKGFLMLVPLVCVMMLTYPTRILLCAFIMCVTVDEYARTSCILTFNQTSTDPTNINILRVELWVFAVLYCVCGHVNHSYLHLIYAATLLYVLTKYIVFSGNSSPSRISVSLSSTSTYTLISDPALSSSPSPVLFHHIALIVFAMTWILWLFAHVACLHSLPLGVHIVVYVIMVTAAGENGGLFGGYMFGKHTPFPTISPKKTREGFTCQVLTSVLTSVCYVHCSPLHSSIPFTHAVLLGLVLGFAAIFGDLFESLFKRCYDKKDTATMLPGWGGLMDRMDGLIFTFPLMFYYMYVCHSHMIINKP